VAAGKRVCPGGDCRRRGAGLGLALLRLARVGGWSFAANPCCVVGPRRRQAGFRGSTCSHPSGARCPEEKHQRLEHRPAADQGQCRGAANRPAGPSATDFIGSGRFALAFRCRGLAVALCDPAKARHHRVRAPSAGAGTGRQTRRERAIAVAGTGAVSIRLRHRVPRRGIAAVLQKALHHRSRNVRAICSCSGLRRNCSGVRSWVWMKASAGMPGTRRISLSRATWSAGSAMRTV
jgi:hypothetical protein